MPPKREIQLIRDIAISRIAEIFEIAIRITQDASLASSFKIRFKSLESIYNEFQEAHIQLVVLLKDEEFADQEEVRKRVDAQYFEICEIYERISPEVKSVVASEPTQSNLKCNARLPKLELIKFDGDYKSWQTFIDLFNSLVHNQAYLSDIEKFQYLTLSLIGEPLTLIKSLPLTGANYKTAYDNIVKRYSNKRLLATNHWRLLTDYPVLHLENVADVRKLIDTFSENLSVLKTLGLNVDSWDFVVSNLLLDKLDSQTRKRFELQLRPESTGAFPSYQTVKDFLEKQCAALETIASSSLNATNLIKNTKLLTISSSHSSNLSKQLRTSYKEGKNQLSLVSSLAATTSSGISNVNNLRCPLCAQSHHLYRCSSFLSKSPPERHAFAKRNRLCYNCLKAAHNLSSCPSSSSCKECGKRHHSTLHFTTPCNNASQVSTFLSNPSTISVQSNVVDNVLTSQNQAVNPEPSDHSGVSANTSVFYQCPKTVLLGTLLLEIQNNRGEYQVLRALCDPGSQASFIVDDLLTSLDLHRRPLRDPVFGIGQTRSDTTNGISTCRIRPIGNPDKQIELNLIAIKHICKTMPSVKIYPTVSRSFEELSIADPGWFEPGPINILLGADVFPSIILSGIKSVGVGLPVALETIFGWILVGPISPSHTNLVISCNQINTFCTFQDSLENTLKAFWEIEEVPIKPVLSPQESEAETLFRDSHFRDVNGRFGVSLPFKTHSPVFNNSREIADRRLSLLERRLLARPDLRKLYNEFMQDYLDSKHMSLIDINAENLNSYFIPHHCIQKGSKFRVVFDASAKASNGVSLNDTLHVGPKLQSDIPTILLRFRCKPIVFTCDVRQMFRQILVAPDHRRYQLIRWRFDSSEPINTYQLNTVTYGVSSSPYLAIRVLLQLAEEGQDLFPLAAEAIKSNLYVDDFACAADSVDSALELQQQLIDLLKTGCLELRKWTCITGKVSCIPLSTRASSF